MPQKGEIRLPFPCPVCNGETEIMTGRQIKNPKHGYRRCRLCHKCQQRFYTFIEYIVPPKPGLPPQKSGEVFEFFIKQKASPQTEAVAWALNGAILRNKTLKKKKNIARLKAWTGALTNARERLGIE